MRRQCDTGQAPGPRVGTAAASWVLPISSPAPPELLSLSASVGLSAPVHLLTAEDPEHGAVGVVLGEVGVVLGDASVEAPAMMESWIGFIPCRSISVIHVWRSRWGWTRLWMPALATASRTTWYTPLEVSGSDCSRSSP